MRTVLTLLALTLCFGLPASAQTSARDMENLAVITVIGSAEVMVAPDEVLFSLDVTKVDKDLQVAKRLNDEAVGKVLELTRRFSIEPQNVKTDYISVGMKYETVRNPQRRSYAESSEEAGTKVFKGYEVSKTVIVKLTDITRFEEFFSEALKTGLTSVNSVSFQTSRLRENRDRARDMAMKAAREKAAAMAASVGQTIGKAVKITEGNSSGPSYSQNVSSNSMSTSGSFSEGVATFAPGAIKVEAQVTASFLLN